MQEKIEIERGDVYVGVSGSTRRLFDKSWRGEILRYRPHGIKKGTTVTKGNAED